MFANFDGNRKELLIRIANSANAEQIGVNCVIKNIDKNIQDKYKVSVDEFIKVYSEDVFASIIAGVWYEYPKIKYSQEELNKIKSRSHYINKVWKDACNLMKREGDNCRFKEYIESFKIKSWEELEDFIFDYYSKVGD